MTQTANPIVNQELDQPAQQAEALAASATNQANAAQSAAIAITEQDLQAESAAGEAHSASSAVPCLTLLGTADLLVIVAAGLPLVWALGLGDAIGAIGSMGGIASSFTGAVIGLENC